VLVIDDDDAVRSAFRLALDDVAAEVVTADSGERGVSVASEEPVDLVFLDLKMPGMDGVDTLRKLRAQGCEAPIFVVTGFAEEFMVRLRSAADRGLDFEVMRKPLERNDIRSVVSAVLGGA
jgi:DNA-binding response OmpR family regulator